MKKTNVIAIDGPSASGKGTLARRIAKTLGYAYLDTGALYRAVAHIVLQANQNPDDEEQALAAAAALSSDLHPEDLRNPALRTDTVGTAASKVAKFSNVRDRLLAFQKDFAQNPPQGCMGAVLDGRDIGTVICPDAHSKLFVTATTEVRAQRRFKELQGRGIQTDFAAVLADMKERDARDMDRAAAPLKPASDAFILDTSAMDAEEAFKKAMEIIRSR